MAENFEPFDDTMMAPAPSATDEWGPGSLVARQLRVVRVLGQGAMGRVLLAHDQALDRDVAVKILRPEVTARFDEDARFRREARLLSRLNHPNVVTVHAYGAADDGSNYIVMEYVDGPSLQELLVRDGVLGGPLTAHLIRQIAAALDDAHRAGIVHRDIKPGNVLTTELAGEQHFVKVADFGLAKRAAETTAEGPTAADITRIGMVVGTPAYMSPEQASGEEVGPATDIYALGVLACQLLTGRQPITGDTAPEILRAHVTRSPTLPSALRPDLGFSAAGAVDQVIARALSKRPEERYATAAAFATELAGALGLSEVRDHAQGPGSAFGALSVIGRGAEAAEALQPGWRRAAAVVVELSLQEQRTDEMGANEELVDGLAVVADRIRRPLQAAGGWLSGGFAHGQLAVFGLRGEEGYGAEAAVRAALHVRSALRALVDDPTMPPGLVVSGHVSVDIGGLLVGEGEVGAPALYGPALAGARRLARLTGDGEVRISQRAWRMVRGQVECDPAEGVGAEAHRLLRRFHDGGRWAPAGHLHGTAIELIGRDAELSALQAGVEEALSRREVTLVSVEGTAGVGKTRLVWEVVQRLEERAEPCLVDVGRCTADGGAPYEPFIEPIRRRAHISEHDDAETAQSKLSRFLRRHITGLDEATRQGMEHALLDLLGIASRGSQETLSAFHSELAEAGARAELFAQLASFYAALACSQPLVTVLDDFQNASAPTRSLLAYMLGQLRDVPLAFVVLARNEQEGDSSVALMQATTRAHRIALSPLDEAMEESLIRHALRQLVEAPTPLVRAIAKLAQGIPRIVEEAILDLVDEGTLLIDGERWRLAGSAAVSLELPETVEQLLSGRIARLPDQLRATLRVASTAGERFWPALLRELDPQGFRAGDLAELERRRLIRRIGDHPLGGEPDYAIVQTALREAVYRQVPARTRHAWHLRIARWLEKHVRGRATRLDGPIGLHFERAGEPSKALRYRMRAAQSAARVHAHDEARLHVSACLDLLAERPDAMPDPGERRTFELSARSTLAHLLVVVGDLARAAQVAEAAFEAPVPAGDVDRKHLARLGIWAGWALLRLGRYAAALERFERAAELARDSHLSLRAATGAASARTKQGDAATACAHMEKAIADHEASGPGAADEGADLSEAYRTLGNCHLRQDRKDAAQAAYERAYELALASNAPEMIVDALNNLAALQYFRGAPDTAEGTWRHALEEATRFGLLQHQSVLLSNLGELAWSRSDSEAAVGLLSRARALAGYIGSDEALADVLRLLTEVTLGVGRVGEAVVMGREGVAAAQRVGVPALRAQAWRLLALALVADAGTDAEIAEAAEQASKAFVEAGDPASAQAALEIGREK